jgi:hypothetical protein
MDTAIDAVATVQKADSSNRQSVHPKAVSVTDSVQSPQANSPVTTPSANSTPALTSPPQAPPQSTQTTICPQTPKTKTDIMIDAFNRVTVKLFWPDLDLGEQINVNSKDGWLFYDCKTFPEVFDYSNFVSVYKRLMTNNLGEGGPNGIPSCAEVDPHFEFSRSFYYLNEQGKETKIQVHMESRLGHICAALNYGRQEKDFLVLYRMLGNGDPVFSRNGDYENIGVDWAVMTLENFKHCNIAYKNVWMSKLVLSKSEPVFKVMYPRWYSPPTMPSAVVIPRRGSSPKQ